MIYFPIKQVLLKPNIARRIIKWAIELSKYDLNDETQGPIKRHILIDFIKEHTSPSGLTKYGSSGMNPISGWGYQH